MNYSNCSDEELVKIIVRDGQIEAFGILYDRYSLKVYNKCLTFVESQSVAEDLTHDIFLKAYLNLKTFKNRSKFSTWFYAITYNMCIDHTRKRYLHKKINYIEFEEIERSRIKVFHCDTEHRLLNLEVEELKKILEKLPPEDRIILLMKYQDEMTIKEIQNQLQISESATKMRLYRAKERAMAIHDKLLRYHKPDGR